MHTVCDKRWSSGTELQAGQVSVGLCGVGHWATPQVKELSAAVLQTGATLKENGHHARIRAGVGLSLDRVWWPWQGGKRWMLKRQKVYNDGGGELF